MTTVQDFVGVALPRVSAPWIKRVSWRGRITSGDRLAFLTFDDGPHPASTPRLLEVLDENQARGTFFMTGRAMSDSPELVRQILEHRHAAGLHGYEHVDPWRARPSKVREDLRRALEVWDHMLGDQPLLYRPPHGHLTRHAIHTIERRSGATVLWDLLAGDYRRNVDPETIADRVQRHVRPGSIVVLHDSPATIATALESLNLVLARLSKEGWRFPPLHSRYLY